MSTPATSPLALDGPPAAPGSIDAAPAGKIGIWMFLATDAMGFAGLLIAYAILRVHADQWPDAQERLAVPQAAVMTGLLVTSSFTMTLAVRAARGRRGEFGRAGVHGWFFRCDRRAVKGRA